MHCIKCNQPLAGNEVECPSCGVILTKARRIPIAALTESAEPPVPDELSHEPVPVEPISLTTATFVSLAGSQPWLSFLVYYTAVFAVSSLVAACGLGYYSFSKPVFIPLVVALVLNGAVALIVLAPLRRFSGALRSYLADGTDSGFQYFAQEQAAFWRRVGVVVAVGLALLSAVLSLALGVVAPFTVALSGALALAFYALFRFAEWRANDSGMTRGVLLFVSGLLITSGLGAAAFVPPPQVQANSAAFELLNIGRSGGFFAAAAFGLVIAAAGLARLSAAQRAKSTEALEAVRQRPGAPAPSRPMA
jgi:hypothetical protein